MDSPRRPDGPPIRDGKPYSRIAHLAEDVVPFIAIAETLRNAGFAAPQVHARSVGDGLLLIEHLGNGRVVDAQSRPIREHPDTGEALLGREIPGFVDVLGFALRAADETGLGYVGADLVVDARHGPVLLAMPDLISG